MDQGGWLATQSTPPLDPPLIIALIFVSYIAWAGSIGIAFTFALGPLTSALVNRLGCRLTAIIGGLSCVSSLLLSSLASSIYIIYVTYSVLFGFGGSCLFVSSYVITSLYFDNNRSIATGILASGTGLGVFAVAPILQALLDSFDWRKTYRITAGIFSIVCVLCLTFDPTVTKKGESRDTEGEKEELEHQAEQEERTVEIPNKWMDFSVFKEKMVVVLTLSFTVAFLGHHTPRLHLVRFYCTVVHKSADCSQEVQASWGIQGHASLKISQEEGKPENPEKKQGLSKDKNQQQTQPTYDARSENRTWATWVGVGGGALSLLHHPCSPIFQKGKINLA